MDKIRVDRRLTVGKDTPARTERLVSFVLRHLTFSNIVIGVDVRAGFNRLVVGGVRFSIMNETATDVLDTLL